MDIAKIEALFAEIRAEVGGFAAGMEDHIDRLLGIAGSDEPAAVVAEPVAEVEPEAPAA